MAILKGKVAVVTGSTSGIGLAYARAFAGAGANIVLNGIGAPADVEKTRTAIEDDFGVKAIYSPANMAEPVEIANMISFAERTFGSVDVLVNNAGIQHVHVWTPLVEKQIPNTMKARNMDRDQVINDVLLAAQPTKEFVTAEQVASLALFLCSHDAAQITGANLSIDGGWTAA
jgi:NAD(P)-dependent dehydrogenase (short-subunit alcohol dehydrogenase family)